MDAVTAQLADMVLDDTRPTNLVEYKDVTLEDLVPSVATTDDNDDDRKAPANLKKLHKDDFIHLHKPNIHLPQDVKPPRYSFSKNLEESERIFSHLTERFEIFVEATSPPPASPSTTAQNRAAVVKSLVTEILTRYSRWLKTLEPTSVSKFTEHTMNATLGSFICGASDIFEKHGYAFDWRYAGTYEKSEEPLISSALAENVKEEEVSKNLSLAKSFYSKVKWGFCDHTLYLRRLTNTEVYLRDVSSNSWSRMRRGPYKIEDDCTVVQFEYKVGRFEYFQGLTPKSTEPESMDKPRFVNRINQYALRKELEAKTTGSKATNITAASIKYKTDRVYPYEVVYEWNKRCDFGGPADYDVATKGQLADVQHIAAADALKRAEFRGVQTDGGLDVYMRSAVAQLAAYRVDKKNEIARVLSHKNAIFDGFPHLNPSEDGVFGDVSFLSVAVVMLNNDIVFKFVD